MSAPAPIKYLSGTLRDRLAAVTQRANDVGERVTASVDNLHAVLNQAEGMAADPRQERGGNPGGARPDQWRAGDRRDRRQHGQAGGRRDDAHHRPVSWLSNSPATWPAPGRDAEKAGAFFARGSCHGKDRPDVGLSFDLCRPRFSTSPRVRSCPRAGTTIR